MFGGELQPGKIRILLSHSKSANLYFHQLSKGIYDRFFSHKSILHVCVNKLPFVSRKQVVNLQTDCPKIDNTWHAILTTTKYCNTSLISEQKTFIFCFCFGRHRNSVLFLPVNDKQLEKSVF